MIGKIQDVVAASVVIGASESATRPAVDMQAVTAVSPSSDGSQSGAIAKKDEAASLEKMTTLEKEQAEKNAFPKMDEESVSRMTEELNDLMSKINCNLEFSYNKEVDMMSVKMTDRVTGEVLKEYPPEDLIQGMIKAREWLGAFLDRNA